MPYPSNPKEVCANVYVAHPLTLAIWGGSNIPAPDCPERTYLFEYVPSTAFLVRAEQAHGFF